MMSPNVRRLVFDPFPRAELLTGLAGWTLAGAYAAIWMTGDAAPYFIMTLFVAGITLSFTRKLPTWLILPVSRRELWQAQWWYIWGLPFLTLVLVTGLAASIDAAFGWLKVSGLDILAFTGAQMTLLFLIGALTPAAKLLGAAAGPASTTAATVGLFASVIALGYRWSSGSTFATARHEMLAGMALSLAIAGIAYTLCERMPLNLQNKPRPKTVQTDTPAQSGKVSTGWAVMFALPVTLTTWLTVIAAVIGVAIFVIFDATAVGHSLDPVDIAPLAALLATVTAISYVPLMPQRALAGLPVSAWQRTIMLHLMSAMIQVPAFAAAIAVVAVMAPFVVSADWLFGRALFVLTMLAVSALILPAALRFGHRKVTACIGIIAVPLVSVNSLLEDTSGAGQVRVIVTVAVLGLYGLGLAWTWLELSRGRAAYRHQPVYPLSWRGGN